MTSVDRHSPMPLYAQVVSAIRERLDTDMWKPGDQIATESELCEEFGVSRTVVRQALDDLVQGGALVRQRGKGTFVARRKVDETWLQRLTGFYEDMVSRGLRPVTIVNEQRILPISKEIAPLLGLAPKTPVVRIDRVRSIAGSTPLLHVVTEIPLALAPGLESDDLTEQSLYTLLEEKYGRRIASGKRGIEAQAVVEPHAHLLGLAPGEPVMRIESVAYLDDGTPLEHFVAYHRGDQTRLEVEVIRSRTGAT